MVFPQKVDNISEQYVLRIRSVLVRNLAISSSDSLQRHFLFFSSLVNKQLGLRAWKPR